MRNDFPLLTYLANAFSPLIGERDFVRVAEQAVKRTGASPSGLFGHHLHHAEKEKMALMRWCECQENARERKEVLIVGQWILDYFSLMIGPQLVRFQLEHARSCSEFTLCYSANNVAVKISPLSVDEVSCHG